MKYVRMQGPLEIVDCLRKKLTDSHIVIKGVDNLPVEDEIAAGAKIRDKLPEISCNFIVESANKARGAGVPFDSSTVIWKYHSVKEYEAIEKWVKHHLKIKALTISIIIPVYNREEHLRLCLEALSQQNIPSEEYEIIVIDDGSQDGSAAVADKFGAKTFRTSNRGPAAARNIGIENAGGDILIFLDSDILVSRDYLQEVRERHSRTNSLLLLGARRHLPEGITNPSEAPVSLDSREKLLRRYSYCLTHMNCPWSVAYTCNFSISRNFLGNIRFDESYAGWGLEDIDFAYELYKQGAEIVFSRGICGYHLYHDRTLTSSRYQSWLINLTRFLHKHPDQRAQGFALFKRVFNPDIKDNYFDVFDQFENRPNPEKNLEIWDLTEINEDPIRWIQQKLNETSEDVLLLGGSSDALLDAYLPFFNHNRIKSFIPKEDWKVVESEFKRRYEQASLCIN